MLDLDFARNRICLELRSRGFDRM